MEKFIQELIEGAESALRSRRLARERDAAAEGDKVLAKHHDIMADQRQGEVARHGHQIQEFEA